MLGETTQKEMERLLSEAVPVPATARGLAFNYDLSSTRGMWDPKELPTQGSDFREECIT